MHAAMTTTLDGKKSMTHCVRERKSHYKITSVTLHTVSYAMSEPAAVKSSTIVFLKDAVRFSA